MIENYFFIHNIFAHFFDDTLYYFADYLYPRFKHQVVGTYDKAVEYINKTSEYGNEHDMPNLPAIVLNPSGEFRISDAISGAQQLWRFPNISGGNSRLLGILYDPIYQDSNVKVSPIFTRIKGEFELILLLNSFYEYCDMKLYLYQIFGGEGRPIYPVTFRTFLIVPEEMLNYQYSNPVTGETHTLDWDGAGIYTTLVKTTNRNEIVVPVNITPRYTLVGMSDGSMKYGGVDKLADWRLNVNIEYEIEMPWYVYLDTDYLSETINFQFSAISGIAGGVYINDKISSYEDFIKEVGSEDNYIDIVNSTIDTGLRPGVHGEPFSDEEIENTKVCEKSEWKKSEFFYYIFNQDDISNLDNNNLTDGFIIPFRNDSDNKLFILSKFGELLINVDFIISDINSRDSLIQIKNRTDDNIVWKVDDILEIYTFIKIR